jgi:hypothetical protein
MKSWTVCKKFLTPLGAAAVAVIFGCTAYTPVQLGQAVPGYDVRVTLSDAGSLDLVPKIGGHARTLEGQLKQASDSSILLSVTRVTREGGGDDTYEALDLTVPAGDVETIEKSQTSVSRSVLTAGAIVATALLAARGAGDVLGGKTGGTTSAGK